MLSSSKSDQSLPSKKEALKPSQSAKTGKPNASEAKQPEKEPEHEPQSQGLGATKDPGKTGGKVTLDDFSKEAGVTDEDVKASGDSVEAMNKMTLEEMRAYVGKPSKVISARSTKDMLAAIASGVMPRWVARVSPKSDFERNNGFGYPAANQIFATEPCDVVGLSAAEALVKVGWTVAQLKGKVGEDISLCVLDTSKVVSRCESSGKEGEQEGGTQTTIQGQPKVGAMNWETLEAAAMDEKGNSWFHHQLTKYAYMHPETQAVTFIKADELPDLFALAKKTAVGAIPDADPVMQAKYTTFRQVLGEGMSASELFSGMGATISEKGVLGCREVMVKNGDSKFALNDDNHVMTPLGKLEQKDLDQLI